MFRMTSRSGLVRLHCNIERAAMTLRSRRNRSLQVQTPAPHRMRMRTSKIVHVAGTASSNYNCRYVPGPVPGPGPRFGPGPGLPAPICGNREPGPDLGPDLPGIGDRAPPRLTSWHRGVCRVRPRPAAAGRGNGESEAPGTGSVLLHEADLINHPANAKKAPATRQPTRRSGSRCK